MADKHENDGSPAETPEPSEDLDALWKSLTSKDDEPTAQDAAPEDNDTSEAADDTAPEDDPDDDDGDAETPPASDDAEADGADPEPEPDLSEQAKRLEQLWKSELGRRKSVQAEVNDLRKQLAEFRRRQETQKTAAKDDNRRREERKRLAEEYPDIAGPLLEEVEDLRRNLGETMTTSQQARAADAQARLARVVQEQEQLVLRDHADGLTSIAQNRDAFEQWISDPERPQWAVDAYSANVDAITDGIAVSRLLTAFKQHLRPQDARQGTGEQQTRLSDRRAAQRAGAASERTTMSRTTKTEPGPNDDPDAIWKWATSKRG